MVPATAAQQVMDDFYQVAACKVLLLLLGMVHQGFLLVAISVTMHPLLLYSVTLVHHMEHHTLGCGDFRSVLQLPSVNSSMW